MEATQKIAKILDELSGETRELLAKLDQEESVLSFGYLYQNWYVRALKLVEVLASDRLDEFCSYYLINDKRKTFNVESYKIQDYIKGHSSSDFDTLNRTKINLMNQDQILKALWLRLDTVIRDIQGFLFSDLQDVELKTAVELKKISNRASGAVAGVVLERHLQRIAHNHNISLRKKFPTISDLNDPLKQAEVYDIAIWRKIQLLADIRNICTHGKDREPTDDQIDELIAGVNSVIKSVF